MTRDEVSVLVVDDVNTMRVQIKDLLKGFGFRKINAVEGPGAAKKALEEGPTHLILCDWQMQPTDGMDLLKYIRSHPDFKNIAFIMVTAESTKEKVIEAIKSGVDDYLIKPLTVDQIQTKVQAVLQRKQVLS